MIQLLRHFRGLAVALAILAISAGAVFAGAPRFVPSGSPVAFDEPVDPSAGDEDGDEDVDEDTDADEDEDADENEDADEDTDGDEAEDADSDEDQDADEAEDADEDAASGDEEGTHGAFVSQVAQSETPEGFENHGAYVSCAARLPDDMVPADASGVTLELCLAAADARATAKAEKHADKDALKEQKAADRQARKDDKDLLDDLPDDLPDLPGDETTDATRTSGGADKSDKHAQKAERAAARESRKADRDAARESRKSGKAHGHH